MTKGVMDLVSSYDRLSSCNRGDLVTKGVVDQVESCDQIQITLKIYTNCGNSFRESPVLKTHFSKFQKEPLVPMGY